MRMQCLIDRWINLSKRLTQRRPDRTNQILNPILRLKHTIAHLLLAIDGRVHQRPSLLDDIHPPFKVGFALQAQLVMIQQTKLDRKRGQPVRRVVRTQQQAILRSARKHPVWLARSFRHKVIHQHTDVRLRSTK